MNDFAVIFDMDGVIVDSSRFHEESWNVLAREVGWTLPPGFFKKTFGMRNICIIPDFLEPGASAERILRLSARKEELFRQLVEGQVSLLPGVRSLVGELHRAGIRFSVGSSTERKNIEMILETTGIAPYFHALVSSEDVTRGKPAPDVFLMAAKKMEIPPSQCVVIEDAQVGIDAAAAAGMVCLALATTHPAESLSGYRRVVPNLEKIRIEDLKSLF
ncbi:MAG: beta-phosphoglucomutase family hydrolase [Verrucomicrobiae bacterium]|nr:beta-phosphoglucomutase family hydrolase [Verrucomicrobiae bacterium]